MKSYILTFCFSIALPPFVSKVIVHSMGTHFAYKVISDVTFEVVKFHRLVKALSLYQPAKEKPSLIGWTGILFIVSSNKTVSLGILAGFPPFVL